MGGTCDFAVGAVVVGSCPAGIAIGIIGACECGVLAAEKWADWWRQELI